MSFGWTLLGTIGQLMLAYLLFMLVAFSGGGIASGGQLSRRQLRILDLSLFGLPGACALSTVAVLLLHWCGGSALSYWWYAMPLGATASYLTYFNALIHRSRHRP